MKPRLQKSQRVKLEDGQKVGVKPGKMLPEEKRRRWRRMAKGGD